MQPERADQNADVALRRKVMAVLAHATAESIAERLSAIEMPPVEVLRAPENGLVMVRGRIGGDGASFNLGEATVTRAAVRLASGETGFAYVLGRDQQKAQLIAICDALVQSAHRECVLACVVAPLERALAEKHSQMAARTAATKVDFFTLVRGE